MDIRATSTSIRVYFLLLLIWGLIACSIFVCFLPKVLKHRRLAGRPGRPVESRSVLWMNSKNLAAEQQLVRSKNGPICFKKIHQLLARKKIDDAPTSEHNKTSNVPQYIHQYSPDGTVSVLYADSVKSWTTVNKKWKYVFWTGDSVNKLLKHYPRLIGSYKSLSVESRRLMIRALVVWQFGGVWSDLDVLSLRSIDVLAAEEDCVIAQQHPAPGSIENNLSNYAVTDSIFFCTARHKFFEMVIKTILSNLRNSVKNSSSAREGYDSASHLNWQLGAKDLASRSLETGQHNAPGIGDLLDFPDDYGDSSSSHLTLDLVLDIAPTKFISPLDDRDWYETSIRTELHAKQKSSGSLFSSAWMQYLLDEQKSSEESSRIWLADFPIFAPTYDAGEGERYFKICWGIKESNLSFQRQQACKLMSEIGWMNSASAVSFTRRLWLSAANNSLHGDQPEEHWPHIHIKHIVPFYFSLQ